MNEQLYALVFICHDLNSILNIKKYLIYSNCYIIFVGNKELLYDNKKIIIARLYDDNIEHEQKLLTFTAWYLIIKNNLFKEYTHICLLEYDVIIKPSFFNELNKIYKKYDVIAFNGGINSFECDINLYIFNNFLKIKNIGYDISSIWYYSTNHCIKRELLAEFIYWYYPDCYYIKLYDNQKFSYYHERLFSVFIKSTNRNIYLLENYLDHIQNYSHDVFNKIDIPITKLFLTYSDNTNYEIPTNKLFTTVKKYSDFNTIIFSKNCIDYNLHNYWKPYIIFYILNQLKYNTILFYLDSKYYFIEKFNKLYEDYLKENDMFVWKSDTDKNSLSSQTHLIDGFIIKKTDRSITIIKEWFDTCCNNGSEDITKHEQLLLNNILNKYNIRLECFPNKYLKNIFI